MAWSGTAFYTEDSLETATRRLINEPVAMVHSDADLDVYLDEAAQELCKIGLLWEATAEHSVTGSVDVGASTILIYDAGGTNSYWGAINGITDLIMPVSVVSYLAAATASPIALTKTDLRQFGHNHQGNEGVPIEWAYDNNNIHIYPYPAATTVFKLHYYKMATAHDVAGLMDWTKSILVWYAVSRCLEREGKLQQSAMYRAFFSNVVMFMRQDISDSDKYADSWDMIKQADYTQTTK